MTTSRWMLVLPPSGAARTVALHTAGAFREFFSDDRLKVVDAAHYIDGYNKLLSHPDETIITDLFNQSCTVACFDFKATHVLSGALAPLTLFTLNIFLKNNITTGLWFYEDFHKATYIERVFRGYDHIFAIQKGDLPAMVESDGTARYHFLPTASGSCTIPELTTSRPYDAVFIGIPSNYRREVLEKLVQHGLRCAIAGKGWDRCKGVLEPSVITGDWCNEQDAFALMQQAKTGLNISFDDPSERPDVHISPRLFDYAAAGCCLVSEEVPLLYDSFPQGSVTTFIGGDDAAVKIDALCKEYNNSSRTRALNLSAVVAHHQYVHRVRNIIDIMEQ